MHYGEIKNCDIANGIGVRVTLFVSGCTNHCEHCFQPQTWDFAYGRPFTQDTETKLLTLLRPEYINGLTLLGGEPFEPANQRVLLPFLQKVRAWYPQKTIWAFSGFTLEELWTPDSYAHCEATAPCWSRWTFWWTAGLSRSRRIFPFGFEAQEISG